MVMETPSPLCVGREFVRQYYTLLNEAPLHLHRFYSDDSSFVHGGVEKPGEEQLPVMGQTDIHKKIQSLNFHDCHAKIRQVDSQATVGNAVVVQVTGELSNGGRPMRRFMQTFILAPQSPKKYYVHNDIFRYQDEVFSDTDSENDNTEETADSEQEIIVERPPLTENVQDSTVSSFYDHGCPVPPSAQQQIGQNQLPAAISNGGIHVTQEQSQTGTAPQENDQDSTRLILPEALKMDHGASVPPDSSYDHDTINQTSDAAKELPTAADELKKSESFSWAEMMTKKKNPVQNSVSHAPAPGAASSIKSAPANSQTSAANVYKASTNLNEVKPDSSTGSAAGPLQQRMPRSTKPRGAFERDSSNTEGGNGGGESADEGGIKFNRPFNQQRYPDNQQLFVGNLVHTVSDLDLRAYFEQYGPVIELRINRKSQANKDVPNYGFVIFENPETAKEILDKRPLMYKGSRLNIEEKKQRDVLNRPGGRGGGRGGLSMGGGPMGGRGGGSSRGGGRGGYVAGPRIDNRVDNRDTTGVGGRGGRPNYNPARRS